MEMEITFFRDTFNIIIFYKRKHVNRITLVSGLIDRIKYSQLCLM